MSLHPGTTDRTNWVFLEPRITRMFWSRRRAWNGAELVLSVETKWVPDGTEVEVTIHEVASTPGSDDPLIETIEGPLTIENGRLIIAHTLALDPGKLAAAGASDGGPAHRRASGQTSLYFRASIERFLIEARSELLAVDVAGYEVGR